MEFPAFNQNLPGRLIHSSVWIFESNAFAETACLAGIGISRNDCNYNVITGMRTFTRSFAVILLTEMERKVH